MRRRTFLSAAISLPLSARAAQTDAEAVALTGASFRIGPIEYRLADIEAPALLTSSPHAQRSQSALADLLRLGVDELREAAPPDRWARKIVVASRFTPEGEKISLQNALLSRGAVWVQPKTDERGLIDEFLTLEAQARADRAGLWGEAAYAPCDAADANGCVGAFRLIEGVVKKTASPQSRTYLNFGDDYRTDFTATVKNRLARKWRKDGFDILGLENRRVRIRGFVEWINGPSVPVTHRQQIEVIT